MHGKDLNFSKTISAVMDKHRGYGSLRIALSLKVSEGRVRRIKQKFNLYPLNSKRKPKKRRDRNTEIAKYPNLTENLLVLAPRTIYASDFTYIPFNGKFVYLATVIDLFSREIVGWCISTRHTTNLVKAALLDSIQRTGATPKISHSDQGSEYKSQGYQNFLKANDIECSMSSKASPWQNGYQESFYCGFKEDLGNAKDFETLGELVEGIHRTINYYNKDRIHTALKMSPQEFFTKFQRENIANQQLLKQA